MSEKSQEKIEEQRPKQEEDDDSDLSSDSQSLQQADIFLETESNRSRSSNIRSEESIVKPKKKRRRRRRKIQILRERERQRELEKERQKQELSGGKKIIKKTKRRRRRTRRQMNQLRQRNNQLMNKPAKLQEDYNKTLNDFPDYNGEDVPDCHFKLDKDKNNMYCRACNEEFAFTSMASAKINQHMLSCHKADFKKRDLFSSPQCLQKEKDDGFFHPKFSKIQTKRSLVWQLFLCNQQIHFVICSTCWMTYNVRDGSTSGMLKHLQKSHEELLARKKKELQGMKNDSDGEDKINENKEGQKRKRRRRGPGKQRMRRQSLIKGEESMRQVSQNDGQKVTNDNCENNDLRVGSQTYGRLRFAYRNDIYSEMGFF